MPDNITPDIVLDEGKTVEDGRDEVHHALSAARAKISDGNEESIVLGKEANHISTTISQSTRELYEKTARRLFHRYLRYESRSHETETVDVSAPLFACFLLSLKPTWKPSTWRMNRQACYRFMRDTGMQECDKGMFLLARDAEIRSKGALDGRKQNRGLVPGSTKRATSSLKQKYIRKDEMGRILAWLRVRSRSDYADATILWLSAGLLTGLRPSEWKNTVFAASSDPEHHTGVRSCLFVASAKTTNKRGFDIMRTLDLTDFDKESLKIVFDMSALGKQWVKNGTFNENQASCSRLLMTACRSLWPRRKTAVSLYSARHQAISNWKQSGKSRLEISVLAGHAALETASENYGRKKSGWRDMKAAPKAIDSELEAAHALHEKADAIKAERRSARTNATTKPSSPTIY